MVDVTIPDEETCIEFDASSVGPHAFSWTYFAKADLRVSIDGVELEQSDFIDTPNITKQGGYDGGSVTLNSAVANGEGKLWRVVQTVRTDVYGAGPLSPQSISRDFTRHVAMAQDARRDIARSLRAPLGEEQPELEPEEGAVIGWAGRTLRNIALASVGVLAVATSWMSLLLNEPGAALANLQGVRWVASNSALEALTVDTGLKDGGVYRTRCASVTRDGGHGDWLYDAAATDTTDGGTIRAPVSGVGRFFRLFGADVHLDWYVAGATGNVTTACQAALDKFGTLNNTSTPTQGSGAVVMGRRDYGVTKLLVRPGTTLRGQSMDASRFVPVSGHTDAVIDFSRPASILSSFTRRYSFRDFSVIGDGTSGQIGLKGHNVAEIEIRRVQAHGLDGGMDFNNSIICDVTGCKINSNTSFGLKAVNACNVFKLTNNRIQATKSGPNLEIDGPASFTWYVANNAIESAGTVTAAAGHGVIVGRTQPVQAVALVNNHYENNQASAVTVGASGASAFSSVDIPSGQFTSSVGKAIHIIGGYVTVGRVYAEGYAAANRLYVENAGTFNARVFNFSDIIPTGAAADTAVKLSFENGGVMFPGDEVRFGDRAGSDYLKLIKRTSDVAVQGTGKYFWVQTELRSNWQGRANLVAGVYSVVFSTPAANASYAVAIGSEGNNHIKISGQTINGFTLTAVDAAGVTQTGDTSRVHWHVFRNQ